ncbi:MAG: hypothetical protein NXH75_06940 [Halobacteriovoraceae bacterium]|nr:hypothetical protein [Halobacteriovoraceae bacterium]
MKYFMTILMLFVALDSYSKEFHHLKGSIIRSLWSKNNEVLFGLKGKKGEAKVFMSEDFGVTLKQLNEGRSLSDNASDVQAVAKAPNGNIYAGTWRNGAYVSKNDGNSFSKLNSVKAIDIRSIEILADGKILMITTDKGLLESRDNGTTFSILNSSIGFCWSFKVLNNGSDIYIATKDKGLLYSSNGGKNFTNIFKTILDTSQLAIINSNNEETFVLATAQGIFTSLDRGKSWLKRKETGDGYYFSISNTDEKIYLGGDSTGLFQGKLTQTLKSIGWDKTAIVNINSHQNGYYLGTWGRGFISGLRQ